MGKEHLLSLVHELTGGPGVLAELPFRSKGYQSLLDFLCDSKQRNFTSSS